MAIGEGLRCATTTKCQSQVRPQHSAVGRSLPHNNPRVVGRVYEISAIFKINKNKNFFIIQTVQALILCCPMVAVLKKFLVICAGQEKKCKEDNV